MFKNPEHSRLTMLRAWVLFMGLMIRVPDMPIEAQKRLGIFDKFSPGAI
jgi:hypothetical protein